LSFSFPRDICAFYLPSVKKSPLVKESPLIMHWNLKSATMENKTLYCYEIHLFKLTNINLINHH
jgi:hypothetical protein